MKTIRLITLSLLAFAFVGFVSLNIWNPEYGYVPSHDKVLKRNGVHVLNTPMQNAFPDDNGLTQPVNDSLLKLGREAFYKETFGNEVFLTDIMGIVDGPLTIPNMTKAIMALKGEGTTNLQVPLAKSVTIGGKTYHKGDRIDTGLDVPKGSVMPLGMPIKYADGRLKVGITCAACHAAVDPRTKQVVEGAPNSDLNVGLLMALATNSSAYFTHTELKPLKDYAKMSTRTIVTSQGNQEKLPDPSELEKAVDDVFAKWPRGNFDSTIDVKSNPAQIPDSFTLGDHPYGWSGFAAAGPFKGLSSFSNNVHAQNADSLSQADASSSLFNIDKEVYLGTILQNAANPKYRFDPGKGKKPSVFFASVDPTPGAPGVNEIVVPPTFPQTSLVAPDGLFVSSPGTRVNEQNNAMAAWQNTLNPPPADKHLSLDTVQRGQAVFQRAGCISCHAGGHFTNNRVVSAKTIGTEPSRAAALKKAAELLADPKTFAPHTPVPVPQESSIVKVPTQHLESEQINLAWAKGNSPGGYKTPSLIGLYWSAPYLHDGGVAVGADMTTQFGMAGTLEKGIRPDPSNSLRALVDKGLRQKVISANRASRDLENMHVRGIGHEFWVDSTTDFSQQEQDALILYLLSL